MIRGLSALLVVFASACGPQSLRVVMNAENNSGQSGFAVLTALSASKTRVEIDIAASNDSRPQPAHVHDGRCGEIGAIKSGLANLAPDPKKAGRFTSSTEIDLGLDALQKGSFAINVHDVRDFSLYISCGQVN